MKSFFKANSFVFIIVIGLMNVLFLKAQDVKSLNQKNQSLSYIQTIVQYLMLDSAYAQCRLFESGTTDIGKPLHLFVISKDEKFNVDQAKASGKAVLFINNGIHPGEPDGIDASVRFATHLLSNTKSLPDNLVICIVPVLNIGGFLNSSCCTRANQNGPEIQGFRGNAKNLDLNRDFIKCDSKNTRSLISLIRTWDPDVFIDTHVSNGADYQYTMTLISTQHNKLGGSSGAYLKSKMTPEIFRMMKERNHEISTYVNTKKYGDSPKTGIYAFLETPRYASGYAALFNCFAFVSESHMLKPFPDRVEATLELLKVITDYTSNNATEIIRVRNENKIEFKEQLNFPIVYEVDTTISEQIEFRGYEEVFKMSTVTRLEQLYYDSNKPYKQNVTFYDRYNPKVIVQKPKLYVIPQAWTSVIDMLQLNKVKMDVLKNDTSLLVETYKIDSYQTVSQPYEGHYLHHSVEVTPEMKTVMYYKGDVIVEVNQDANKYIVESLEPEAPDSFFAWGFFDSILQQKEWFSSYIFDNTAEKILAENPELKAKFEQKRNKDGEFAESAFTQLYFIYQNSEWFEDLNRYPVGRILSNSKL